MKIEDLIKNNITEERNGHIQWGYGCKSGRTYYPDDFRGQFDKMLDLLIELSQDGKRKVYFDELEAFYEDDYTTMFHIFYHVMKDGLVHCNSGVISLI